MRVLILLLASGLATSQLSAQATDPPLDDTRLTIHTLVREDVFAGWRADNMQRLERAERNIESLLETRPAARAELLSWKGAATLYRAVLAHESGEADEFQALFDAASDNFREARQLDRSSIGVCAVCGGSLVMFGDRLPESVRDQAYTDAWEDYQIIWKQQGEAVQHMPLHISGELLAGLAQAADRTGRTAERDEYLDKIIEVLPESAYAREAAIWKDDPRAAAGRTLACKSCHAAGRLTARLREENRK